jgi:hypothetical protein
MEGIYLYTRHSVTSHSKSKRDIIGSFFQSGAMHPFNWLFYKLSGAESLDEKHCLKLKMAY